MLDAATVPPHLRPLIADNFAGGGGASSGIAAALGRDPDYAINHDAVALAMHEANHPETVHLTSDIWEVDPSDLVAEGQQVGLAWFSPDCKHHSKAKGGKPVEKGIRDLAWVVVKWAKKVRPRLILLENVEEFQDWCPLTDANKPDLSRRGETFRQWVAALESEGYAVEWRELRACDYGAPTIRKRLFVVARCDGEPIVWPAPSHGAPDSEGVRSGTLTRWRTAADIIDWSLPCPSIFDTSAQIMEKHGLRAVRPLADNTLKRIARGVQRYVLGAAEPFFVSYAQHGGANRSALDPLHTVTASKKDQNVVIAPTLVQTGYGERKGQKPRCLDIQKPLGTIVAGGGKHALIAPHLMVHRNSGKPFTAGNEPVHTVTAGGAHMNVVAAFLAQHNTGVIGRRADAPLSTVTTTGAQQNVVAASMMSLHGSDRRDSDARAPLPTICAGGGHAAIIAAFLTKYYGQGFGAACDEPAHTLTTRDRFGLVTVAIGGVDYVITDIGMRMLTPREQFRAQGFPDDYQIDRDANGRALTKSEKTRMCGNSVSPVLAEALVRANYSEAANAAAASKL